jgi:drug/metabolite transporter (DMT)-like permease
MSLRDSLILLLLGAIWGGSFLFLRVAAPEFGPLALIEVRLLVSAGMLFAALAWRRQLGGLAGHGRRFFVVAVTNSAVPFVLFAFAALSLSAGFSAVLNATTPLFGALLGLLVLGDHLAPSRLLGLGLGFVGVVGLVFGRLATPRSGWAIAAGLLGASLYAIAIHYTRRRFAGTPPLVIAAGSQLAAALLLLVPALLALPAKMPSAKAWLATLALGILCTGIAQILFFRLLARIGPMRAMLVTYLTPLFGVLWGWLFLAEPLSLEMVVGSAVILLGTALSSGVLASAQPAATQPTEALLPTPAAPAAKGLP